MNEGRRAYIGVGSNIDPQANILRALDLLRRRIRVIATSTFYWTDPIGRPDQPRYLNGVWCAETAMHPRDLKFDVLRPIEEQLGRVRSADRYAPRTIDLDVLLCDGVTVNQEHCRIPAPEVRTRAFVAVGLLELFPDAILPDTGERLCTLEIVRTAADLDPAAEFTRQLRARLREQV